MSLDICFYHCFMYMYLPNLLHKQDVTQGKISKLSFPGLNLEFSFF